MTVQNVRQDSVSFVGPKGLDLPKNSAQAINVATLKKHLGNFEDPEPEMMAPLERLQEMVENGTMPTRSFNESWERYEKLAQSLEINSSKAAGSLRGSRG